MKTNFIKRITLMLVVFGTTTFYIANAQKVDTLQYKKNIKICKTALWKVSKVNTAETWFGDRIKGDACLTSTGDNSFQIDWNITVYGFLHEVGLYDLNVPVDAVNPKAKSKYKHEFSNVTGSGGYTGLYGWFGKAGTPESIELYINENCVGNKSMDMSSHIKMGTITVDGATYDIYTRPRKGDLFAQWWSNRTSPRTEGTISYAKHFQEWRKLGMPDINLTRLTYAFESNPFWSTPSGGTLKYSYFKIDKP